MDDFADADPDVEQAEASDQAANPALLEEIEDGGVRQHPAVLLPVAAPPGKPRQQASDIKAEDDEDAEAGALQPDGGWVRNSLLRYGWWSARVVMSLGKELALLRRHPFYVSRVRCGMSPLHRLLRMAGGFRSGTALGFFFFLLRFALSLFA